MAASVGKVATMAKQPKPKPHYLLWQIPKDWDSISEAEREAFVEKVYKDLEAEQKRLEK